VGNKCGNIKPQKKCLNKKHLKKQKKDILDDYRVEDKEGNTFYFVIYKQQLN
jgi:hypothetical protein